MQNSVNFWQYSVMRRESDEDCTLHFCLKPNRRMPMSPFKCQLLNWTSYEEQANRRRSLEGEQAGSKARTRRRTTGACAKRPQFTGELSFRVCARRVGEGEQERSMLQQICRIETLWNALFFHSQKATKNSIRVQYRYRFFEGWCSGESLWMGSTYAISLGQASALHRAANSALAKQDIHPVLIGAARKLNRKL